MNIWQDKKWQPMLLKEIGKPFNSKDYIYELKFDGYRAVVFATPKKVIIKSRYQEDLTHIYPELQKIKNLVKEATIFDGEIVSFANNKPSFSKLQERSHLKNKDKILRSSITDPVIFVCFDILYMGKVLTNEPLIERKKYLSKFKDNEVFLKNTYIEEKGKELFKLIQEKDLEGIIAKKKDSLYLINTRTDNWLKIKNLKKEKFYIGGYTENKDSYVISLYLGEYVNNEFKYVGKVAMAKKNLLYLKIKNLKKLKNSPFKDYNELLINYVKPTLKCRVKYLERTKSNHLRQPVIEKEN